MIARIKLHLTCPCRSWQNARFHLAGILREFLPHRWSVYVR